MGVGRGATRVAIYARVSTGEQTPELQLRELRDYAGHRKRRQPLRAISLRSGADAASLTRFFRRMRLCPRYRDRADHAVSPPTNRR